MRENPREKPPGTPTSRTWLEKIRWVPRMCKMRVSISLLKSALNKLLTILIGWHCMSYFKRKTVFGGPDNVVNKLAVLIKTKDGKKLEI